MTANSADVTGYDFFIGSRFGTGVKGEHFACFLGGIFAVITATIEVVITRIAVCFIISVNEFNIRFRTG